MSRESAREGCYTLTQGNSFHNQSFSKAATCDKVAHAKPKKPRLPPSSNSKGTLQYRSPVNCPHSRKNLLSDLNQVPDQADRIFDTSAKRSLVYKSPSLKSVTGQQVQFSSGKTIKIEDYEQEKPVNEPKSDQVVMAFKLRQRCSDIREEHDSQLTTQKTEQSNEKKAKEASGCDGATTTGDGQDPRTTNHSHFPSIFSNWKSTNLNHHYRGGSKVSPLLHNVEARGFLNEVPQTSDEDVTSQPDQPFNSVDYAGQKTTVKKDQEEQEPQDPTVESESVQ